MPAIIRPASHADLPAILALERASPAAAHWRESEYSQAIDSPDRLVLIAEIESNIIGFVVTLTVIPEWELENIAVDPASRRCGVGRALMNDLIQAAKMAGATEIRQEIRASNPAAQRLAQSCGFVQQGRRMGYYREPTEDAILFHFVIS